MTSGFTSFRRVLLITMMLATVNSQAQDIQVFHEDNSTGAVILASNGERYPISVSLDFKLSNMRFSGGEERIFIIPPQSERFKLGELTAVSRSDYHFDYTFLWAIGDVNVQDYDHDYIYDLPYKKGKQFRVQQGYNGSFSHENENAIDFDMPEGTEVVAARGGMVVEVEQSNTVACPREECKQYNNFIMIMHNDGTYARYMHIRYNGSMVNPGDEVKAGDPIAYSGNVGWSDGPHLHFVCFIGKFEKWNSLETKFKIGNGKVVSLLEQGRVYKRDY